MAELFSFPPLNSTAFLDEFDRTGNPSYFLDALESILARNGEIDALEDRKGRFLEIVNGIASWRERFDLLARTGELLARIYWGPTSPGDVPEAVEEDASLNVVGLDELEQAAIKAIQDLPRQREKQAQEAKASGIGNFKAGLPWLDLAKTLFGDDHPLAAIDEAFAALVTDDVEPQRRYWFSDEERWKLGEQTKTFILVRVFCAQLFYLQKECEGSVENYLRPLLTALLIRLPLFFLVDEFFGEDAENSEQAAMIATALANAPEERHFDIANCLESVEGYVACLLSPGFLPLPQGLFIAILRRFADLKTFGDLDSRLRIFHHLLDRSLGAPGDHQSLPKFMSSEQTLEAVRAAYPAESDYPFLPLDVLFELHLLDFEEPLWVPEETQKLMTHFSRQVSLLRVLRCKQRFPWHPERTDYLTAAVSFDLAHTASPDWDLFVSVLWVSWEISEADSEVVFDWPSRGFETFRIYRALWFAADREGLSELGNAFLSFYLLRKFVDISGGGKSPDIDWPDFVILIRASLEQPGGQWVKTVLQHLEHACKEHGWLADSLRLRNIVGTGSQLPEIAASLYSVPAGRGEIEASTVKSELEQEFPALNKLCTHAQECLVDAEFRFKINSEHMGRRTKDRALDVLAYAKPFEIELDERLGKVIAQPAIQAYLAAELRNWSQNRSKPTLGTYLTLLGKSVGMPDVLRQMIAEAVGELAGDAKTISALGKIKKNRDPAAHTRRILASELMAQKEIVFEQGLLENFLAHLPDR